MATGYGGNESAQLHDREPKFKEADEPKVDDYD